MSLDALGAAIHLERARFIRRPAPGAAPPRTKDEAATQLAVFDEDFERAAAARAHTAEVRRTEIKSRIAAHHLDRIFEFGRRLEAADVAAERALELAERAFRAETDDARQELADEAAGLLAALEPVPAPEGPRSPTEVEIDFSTPEATSRSARHLESFRRSLGRSSGQLAELRDLVLDNVAGLAGRRRDLRGIENGSPPSPARLRQRVGELRQRILADPGAARRAQANLPRGMVLMMVRGR